MAPSAEQLEVLKGEARGADAAFAARLAQNGDVIGAWIGTSTRMLRALRAATARYGALLRRRDWFRALRLGRAAILQHARLERLARARAELLRLQALRATNAQASHYLQELKYDKLAVLLRRQKTADEDITASAKARELRRAVVASIESKLLDVPAAVLRRSLKEDADLTRPSPGMRTAVGLQIAATLLGFTDYDADFRTNIMVNAWYKVYIDDALRTWEARVSLDHVDVKPEDKLVQMVNELYISRQNAPAEQGTPTRRSAYISEDFLVFWDRLNTLGYGWCVLCSSLKALATQTPYFTDSFAETLPAGFCKMFDRCLTVLIAVLPLSISFGGRHCINDILSITAAGLITARRQLEKLTKAPVEVESLLDLVPSLQVFVTALLGCLEKEIRGNVINSLVPDMLDEYRAETFVPPIYDSDNWELTSDVHHDWQAPLTTQCESARACAVQYLDFVLNKLPLHIHGFGKLLPAKPHSPFRNHWLVKLQSIVDLNKPYSPSRVTNESGDLSLRLFRSQTSIVRAILTLTNHQLFVPPLRVVEESAEQLMVILLIITIRSYVRNKLLLKMLVQGESSKHIDDQIHWRRRYFEREYVSGIFDKYRSMQLPFVIPNNTCDRLGVLKNAEANSRRLNDVVRCSILRYFATSGRISEWTSSFQQLPAILRNLSLDSYIIQCTADFNVGTQWFTPIREACYWSTDEVFVKHNIELVTTEFMKYMEVDDFRCAGIDKQLVDLYCHEKDAKARRLMCDGVRLSRLSTDMEFKNFDAVTSREASLLRWWCEHGKALVLCAPSSIRTLLKRIRPEDVASFDAFAAQLCAEHGPL